MNKTIHVFEIYIYIFLEFRSFLLGSIRTLLVILRSLIEICFRVACEYTMLFTCDLQTLNSIL